MSQESKSDKENKISIAVILAGGIAKRMESGIFPKSLIPVELINTLSNHLLQLKKLEIEKIIISVYKKNSYLKDFLKEFSKELDMEIKIIEEDLCGSGGSLQNTLKSTDLDEIFLCISSDCYFFFDYKEIIKKFESDTFLLFRKFDEGLYSKDKDKRNSYCLSKENEQKYCYSGIGVFDAKLLKQFSFMEKEFDLSKYLIEISSKGKLNGMELNFPFYNLNCYKDVLNINRFQISRKKFINKFCVKGIKCILFDLDFTLVDSSNIVIEGINYSCEKLNIPKLTKEEIYSKTKFILPRDKVIKLSKELCKEENDKFVEYYYEYIIDKRPILYPGAISLLYFLQSQGFLLGIVTLKSKKVTQFLLDEFNIRNLFKTVITYDEVSKKKPNPEGLITAAKNLSLNTEDCLYIGDDINDGIAAQNCDMFFMGVTTGQTLVEEFYKIGEYKIYKDLIEIENKFRQLCLLYQYSVRYPHGVKDMVITSEKIHPDTKNLSYLILKNPKDGIDCLLQADILSLKKILVNEGKIEYLTRICHDTIKNGNKIHIYGCGSSGRLIVLLERLMIQQNNPIRNNITFNASGLDTIIPRSFADFEDNVNFGVKQLLHVNYSPNDLVITVSGSGTAPFLLEILRYAAENGNISPIHLFCNSEEELAVRCSEHKIFSDKNIRKKINFFTIPCGPMSITGSTRLQATLVLTITLGCILLKYNYKDFINSLILILKNLDLSDIAILAKREVDIYKKNEKIIYKTDPDHAFITMMDTTERTATFNLSPFKNLNDPAGVDSLCYLNIINSKNSEDALFKIFLRAPNVLNWKEYPRTSKEYFFGYDFSTYDENIYKNSLNIFNDGKYLEFSAKDINLKFNIPRKNELEYQMVFKTIINIYSNIVMGMLKLYEGNVMTNVTACNTKLIGRICYLVEGLTELGNYNIIRDVVFQEVLNLKVNQSIIKNCLNKIKVIRYINKYEEKHKIIPKFQLIRYLYNNEIEYQKITKINEGYGNREYYRIENNGNKNILIAIYPDEKTIKDFIKISEIFKNCNINFPNFSKIEKNIMILEDLGTEHFKSKDFLKIIDIIISLQDIDYYDKNIPIYSKELIYEEMIGFLYNFIQQFLEIKITKEEEEYIISFCDDTSKRIFKSENKCFLHKDLNPSNILIKDNKFYLIDFQDALIGSSYYDLASLLFNEREILTEEQIYKGIKYFLEKSKFKNNFDVEFPLCVFHRILKNLGCFAKLYLQNKDEKLISYIQRMLDMGIFMSEVKQVTNLKNTLEECKNKFYEIFYKNTTFEKNDNLYYINANINLIKAINNHKFFIVTGTSTSKKTTTVKDCEFDCKISFDELLKEVMEEDLKIKNIDDYKILKKYFIKDIWYFVRHFGIVGNPFTDYYLSKLSKDEKEIIEKALSNLHLNLLDSLKYREKTWEKLLVIIKDGIARGNSILLDISYLNEDDYYKLKDLANDNYSYYPFVILNCIKLDDMTKLIKMRNMKALENKNCTEYRHVILNIYMYLQYYKSEDLSENYNFIVEEETMNKIKKEIPEIDPYANTYHWEKFKSIIILNEFKFPLKMRYPKFIAFRNLIKI